MSNNQTINLSGVSANSQSSFYKKNITINITNEKMLDKLTMMSYQYRMSVNDIVNDIIEAYCFPESVKYLGIKKE